MDNHGVWESGRHIHGKIGDESRLGDLHIKDHFLGFVCTVDNLAGDDIVGKARGDLAVDFQTPYDHTIDSLKGD